ncbi:DPP IV N-terminal domain-containing protein [Salinibacter ruber]|uniref:DPP IV N-terminal domain-containing protein n=1 Tax=Salinibacter ruber TaxID=146919 RepID=UPI000E579CE5|nr:DPP IV N-terminal domain-containing protein [Salinibacter ruber]
MLRLIRAFLIFSLLTTGALIVGCDSGGSSMGDGDNSHGSGANRIVFQSDRDGENDRSGDIEIYTISPSDPPDLRQVTNTTVNSLSPTWSPDGNQIAFQGRPPGEEYEEYQIYTIRPGGSNLRQVTDYYNGDDSPTYNGGDYSPAWSPNGSRIAFTSDRDEDGDSEIYTIDPDGSDLKQVTDNDVSDASLAWSPDGSRIAFSSNRDGDDEIYTIDPDGSDLKQVTDQNARDAFPAWSPDGSRIVFSSNRDGDDDSEIYTIDPDGSDLRQITETGDNGSDGIGDDDVTPAWSPDGSRIAFGRSRDARSSFSIYTIGADGSDPRRITKSIHTAVDPAWLPSQ